MRDNAHIASGLSPRLAAAKAMLGSAHTIWDVGCDHGFLAAELIKCGAALRVIATDLSPVSVAKAQRHSQRRGTAGSMSFAAADGLTGFSPEGEYKLVICGMGGELIAQILERGADIARNAALIVMQPMRGEEELRCFLCENGYGITEERAVCDDGRYYQLIAARFGASSTPPDWFPKGYYRLGWVMCESPSEALMGLLAKYRRAYAVRLRSAEAKGVRPQRLIDELEAVDTIIAHINAQITEE